MAAFEGLLRDSRPVGSPPATAFSRQQPQTTMMQTTPADHWDRRLRWKKFYEGTQSRNIKSNRRVTCFIVIRGRCNGIRQRRSGRPGQPFVKGGGLGKIEHKTATRCSSIDPSNQCGSQTFQYHSQYYQCSYALIEDLIIASSFETCTHCLQ